ncbi:hypothetical protein L0F63_004298, partial [Massospora cicadina]
ALLSAGLPLDSLEANASSIRITYCRIKPKPSKRGISNVNPVDEGKESEDILWVLQVVYVMANQWVTKDCWRSVGPWGSNSNLHPLIQGPKASSELIGLKGLN